MIINARTNDYVNAKAKAVDSMGVVSQCGGPACQIPCFCLFSPPILVFGYAHDQKPGCYAAIPDAWRKPTINRPARSPGIYNSPDAFQASPDRPTSAVKLISSSRVRCSCYYTIAHTLFLETGIHFRPAHIKRKMPLNVEQAFCRSAPHQTVSSALSYRQCIIRPPGSQILPGQTTAVSVLNL